MTNTATLPTNADVVIVGSGAAGLCAAITLKLGGLAPIVIEKTGHYGGSTAVSGGAVWIPGNHHSEVAGHPDTPEAAMAYLEAELGNRLNRPVVEAFLQEGPRMVKFLEENSAVEFAARTFGPDYHPDLEGGTLGGRVMDPLDFDGRELGVNFNALRFPIPEFTVLGGMMVGRSDLAHLPNMWRKSISFVYALKVIARHAKDRLSYQRGTRLTLGNALAARLAKTVFDLGIPIVLNTPLTDIVYDQNGRVSAVISHEHRCDVRQGVILASGGFASSETLRRKHIAHSTSTEHFSMTPAGNTGDAITIAKEAGAELGSNNLHPAFWAPVSRLKRPDGRLASFPHLFLDRAKPGLIAITECGKRFVNESASYHDFVAAMLEEVQTNHIATFYLICDHRFIRRYGLGAVKAFPSRVSPFIDNGYLTTAKTIKALEVMLSVPVNSLCESVAGYNQNANKGEDPDFNKGGSAYNRYLGDPEHKPNPCLRAIDKGPYYALRVYPGDIGTSVGLNTNRHAQVLNANDQIIDGMYACGNDMNSIMAGSYPGPGITLGPALTFGYIAANHILKGLN